MLASLHELTARVQPTSSLTLDHQPHLHDAMNGAQEDIADGKRNSIVTSFQHATAPLSSAIEQGYIWHEC